MRIQLHPLRSLFLFIALAALTTGMDAQVPSVPGVAHPVDDRVKPAQPDASAREPVFQDFDPSRYEPLPLPRPATGTTASVTPAGDVISYEVATGRVFAAPSDRQDTFDPPENATTGSGGRVVGQGESPGLTTSFSVLSKLGNYQDYPWSMNVKLFITFSNNRRFVGSGVLIDPKHVLTCGHCVYDNQMGGFAEDITVVPAYNGELAGGAGREPYGTSSSTQLHTWSGWAYNRDLKHDIGIIDLDRPVGALIGWFGYGYAGNSTITSSSWNHASYPAESPYDGKRMYYNYGTFDSCPNSLQARFDRRSYGGESGSGHFMFVNSKRVVYALLSNGTSKSTWSTRLDSGKFKDVGNVLDADRPATYDLTPLQVSGATTVFAGGRIDDLIFKLHNYSKADINGYTNFSVYLSTNDYISTNDTMISTYGINLRLPALNTVGIRFNGNEPRIPDTMKPGTYYVGIILNTKDANTMNQHTLSWDVLKITVRSSVKPVGVSCPAGLTLTSTPHRGGNSYAVSGTGAPPNKLGGLFLAFPISHPFQVLPGVWVYIDPARITGSVGVASDRYGNWIYRGTANPLLVGNTIMLQAAFYPLSSYPHIATTHGLSVEVLR